MRLKSFVVFFIFLFVSVFTSCSYFSDVATLSYNKSLFNISMEEVLESSMSFVQASVTPIPENAKDEEKEEIINLDNWQGFIDDLWNVPSSVYGTSLDSELVINGENLGTLQNLFHHKDAYGNFEKAVFEYNDFVYYVLHNGSSIVLSKTDSLDYIFLDKDDKIGTSDFSNFKMWIWDESEDGLKYRKTNLGNVYILRNVLMQDGSYATITLGDYNYEQYGMRVWIKPQTNNL